MNPSSTPLVSRSVPAARFASGSLRLHGKRIYLRPVAPSDANENYLRWMNDPEVTRYLESRFVRHTAEGLRDYIAEKQDDPDTLFLAIVLRQGDRHIGNIKLGPIDWHHCRGEVGIILGEKDCWGKGYATEAIQLLADYAFGELKLHKLTAGCYSVHPGSARAFQKAGFVVEGLRPSHCLCDDRYVHLILLGKWRSEAPNRPAPSVP